MHEIPRTSIDVAVVAFKLKSEHATNDVQARLIALVMVPADTAPGSVST
jgi:hypothetical protein